MQFLIVYGVGSLFEITSSKSPVVRILFINLAAWTPSLCLRTWDCDKLRAMNHFLNLLTIICLMGRAAVGIPSFFVIKFLTSS